VRAKVPFFILGSFFIAAGVVYLVRSLVTARVDRLRAAWKAAGEA